MSRQSNDEYREGLLYNGYDYVNQSWVVDGKYVRCGHPEKMDCGCFGRIHEGQTVEEYRMIERMDEENEAMRDWVLDGGAPELAYEATHR